MGPGSIELNMDDFLEAVSLALTSIALSVRPDEDLDGTIISLENVLQQLYQCYQIQVTVSVGV